MVTGAAGYVLFDKQFAMDGMSAYSWVMIYFVVISFEMALGKYIVGPQLGFASMWGPTLYTNTIAIPPMVIIGLATGEFGPGSSTELESSSNSSSSSSARRSGRCS